MGRGSNEHCSQLRSALQMLVPVDEVISALPRGAVIEASVLEW